MAPHRKGNATQVMESKSADAFAFGMLAVEVFTGRIPFEEHRDEIVVLHILQGDRPEIPQNAQDSDLTAEMWTLLESCWQHNPNRRPTMRKVVRKWQRFISNDENSDVFLECVYINSELVQTSF